MNALEIIWILLTVGNIWWICRLFKYDETEFAIIFIMIKAVSIALLIGYWQTELTTALW